MPRKRPALISQGGTVPDTVRCSVPIVLGAQGDGDGTAKPRTMSAQLVTYGKTVHPQSSWGMPVRFAKGALETPDNLAAVKLCMDHDTGRVVGAMTDFTTNKAGPYGTFRFARTGAADDAFVLAEDGILDSVSVGARVHDYNIVKEDDVDVVEVTRATLFEVSLVGHPADTDALIDSVTARKAPAMPTTETTVEAPELSEAQLEQVLAAMQQRMAPPAAAPVALEHGPAKVQIIGQDGKPVALARQDRIPSVLGNDGKRYTAGDYFQRYAKAVRDGETGPFNEIRAALADEITTDVPGLLPTAIVGELLGRASGRRPVWESFTARDMPMAGAKFDRPKITQHVQVGARGAEKTNPPSRKFLAVLEEVNKQTWAGGLDVSFEALDWTSPSLLNELIIDFTRMYLAWTDQYAATALVAATTAGAQSVTWDGTAATLNKALTDAAILVANGVGPEVDAMPNTIWLAMDVWGQLAALNDTTNRPLLPKIGPTNAMGTMDVSDPYSGPGGTGFRWVVSRRFPAGTFIMGDREYCESYENGRRFLQANNVPALGLDMATMGYGATYFPYTKTLVKIGPAAG